VVAIACQETGDVWPTLCKKPLAAQEIVALCAPDICLRLVKHRPVLGSRCAGHGRALVAAIPSLPTLWLSYLYRRSQDGNPETIRTLMLVNIATLSNFTPIEAVFYEADVRFTVSK
jgi:hypothetical protein